MLISSRTLLLALTTGCLALACVDPPYKPIENEYPPKGVMRGTVTYSGPLPCSEGGHIVGNAQILIFNVNLLPPPEGLGLSSHRIAAIPGDVLFADAAPYVPTNADGTRACPPPGTQITATATFEVGPIDPGVYQARAFFDYDGDFAPAFKMANMVTKGDVPGGAIANITAVLQDPTTPIQYQEIPVGVLRDGAWTIPAEGFVVSNVGVTLSSAATVWHNRPYFHVSGLQNPFDEQGVKPPLVDNPTEIVVPADFHAYNAGITAIQDSIYTLTLKAGLPGPENIVSQGPPFYFDTNDPDPFKLLLSSYDADHDGDIVGDHITGSTLVPAIGPIVSFTKLDRANDPTNLWRISQAKPRVLSSGITTPSTLVGALGKTYPTPEPVDQFNAIIRPTALCLADAADRNSETVIVTPFENDLQPTPAPIISDVPQTIQDIAEQIRRELTNIKVVYQCLPPGYYAINVIYPDFGQVWTLPNESGICMPGEAPGEVNGMPTCGQREKLSSQFLYVRFGEAKDPAYCNSVRPRPVAGQEAEFEDPYRDSCLTPAERQMYLDGTLWGGPPDPIPDYPSNK